MFKIIRGDITKLEVDAIVNSAHHIPLDKEPFGTDRAIHRAAGVTQLLKARQEIGTIEFGDVRVTKAFNLEPKVKYIMHAVAPIWRGGTAGEVNVLQSCYKKSLELALRMGFKSIAFPVMAAGVNGVPINEALKIAIDGITDFLFENVDYKIDVTLVIFDREMFELCEKIFPNIEKHLDEEVIEALAMVIRMKERVIIHQKPKSKYQKKGISQRLPPCFLNSFRKMAQNTRLHYCW